MRTLSLQARRPSITHRASLISITCNCCGNAILQQLRVQDIQDVPGVFQADFVALSGKQWKADLCGDCTIAVRDFINQGAGPGVQLIDHETHHA